MNYTGKTPQVIDKTIHSPVDYFKYQEFISQIVLFFIFFLKFCLNMQLRHYLIENALTCKNFQNINLNIG